MAAESTELTFAEKQMAKYGWKEGMGLGKNNDGISEALRVRKRADRLGMGQNVKEKHQHWWDHAYNRAVDNITVTNTEEGVTITKNSDESSVSKERPNLFKGSMLYDNFKRVGTLDGNKYVDVDKKRKSECLKTSDASSSDSSSDSDSDDSSDNERPKHRGSGLLLDMTDDQLLKLCGGRTLHKAARHGIRMTGKMKRLEDVKKEEDAIVSHWLKEETARKLKKENKSLSDNLVDPNFDDWNKHNHRDIIQDVKRKARKNSDFAFSYNDGSTNYTPEKDYSMIHNEQQNALEIEDIDASDVSEEKIGKKKKKRKTKELPAIDIASDLINADETGIDNIIEKKKKRKKDKKSKRNKDAIDLQTALSDESPQEDSFIKKTKKNKLILETQFIEEVDNSNDFDALKESLSISGEEVQYNNENISAKKRKKTHKKDISAICGDKSVITIEGGGESVTFEGGDTCTEAIKKKEKKKKKRNEEQMNDNDTVTTSAEVYSELKRSKKKRKKLHEISDI